jgi:hypothetical protein
MFNSVMRANDDVDIEEVLDCGLREPSLAVGQRSGPAHTIVSPVNGSIQTVPLASRR